MSGIINKHKSRFPSIEKLVEMDNKMKNQDIETTYVTLDAIVDLKGFRRCPHCNESYYMEKYSETTAAFYPPIYKDGERPRGSGRQRARY